MVKDSFDTFEEEIELFGSEYEKERYLEEELEPPSYKNKIPLGRNPDTGEVKWIDMNDDDRWGIIGRTGSGKCVDPSTKINTNKYGKIKVKKLFNKTEKSIEGTDGDGIYYDINDNLKIQTLTEDGKVEWKAPNKIYKQKVSEKMVKVSLSDGSEIKITKEHPLLSENGWTKARDLEEGEKVGVPSKIPFMENKNIKKDHSELISWQISEGCETSSKSRVKIGKKNRDILRRIQSLVDNIGLNKESGIRDGRVQVLDSKINPVIRENSGDKVPEVRWHSTQYKRWLEDEFNYDFGNNAHNKKIPRGIKNADREAKKIFLQTYLDADGTVHEGKGTLSFSSSSKELLKDLKTILREFGIFGILGRKKTPKEHRDGWRITIGSEEREKYRNKIGFNRKKLPKNKKKLNSNTSGIPQGCRIITELKENNIALGSHINNYGIENDRTPSRSKLKELTEKLDDLIEFKENGVPGKYKRSWSQHGLMEGFNSVDKDYFIEKRNEVQELIDQDVWWVKIEEIEEIDYEGYVYDLSVPETHNFVAEDIICHNTWTLKELVSRLFDGGMGIIHLSDVKNDFANIGHGDGIQKNKMNLLKNEQRKSIPVNMMVPRFLAEDYHDGIPSSDHFHKFSYSISDLSESDFLQLLKADSTSARNIAIALYEQVEEGEADNITDLINFLEEDESMEDVNTMAKRSMKSTLESIKKQGVVSNRGQKSPVDYMDDSVVAIAFENYDRYKRKSIEKLELQISITIRKILDKIREKETDKEQYLLVVDEAHAFATDSRDSISTDDIIDAVDLGRAYGLPMAFATQKYTDLASGIRTQCNKFLLSQNITVEERRVILKETGHYKSGDAQRGKFQRIFSSMDKHEWMYVDDQEYYKVKPLSPLCRD